MTTVQSPSKLHAWLEALSSDPSGMYGAESLLAPHPELDRLAKEGALIRKILVQREVHVAAAITSSTPDALRTHRETTLLRARQAGLFLHSKQPVRRLLDAASSLFASPPQQPASTGSKGVTQSLALTRVGIAAAFGLLLVVLYMSNRPVAVVDGYPDGVVMRGDEQAQRLQTANPGLLADQVEAVLRQEGAPVRRFTLEQAIVIQAKVLDLSHVGRARLIALGAVVPEHGRLHLRIEGK